MRSKEEILKQHCKFIHFEKTNITFENVSQAMDTYAAQSVEYATKGLMFKAWCAARNYDFIENIHHAISELDRSDFEQWYNQQIDETK